MDWSWATGGITESMPRTTGPECINYLTSRRKSLESIIITGLCLLAMKWSIQRLQPITLLSPNKLHKSMQPLIGKQILLISMTFVFGMECGFKLATKTVIFIFNPCHITTIIQIYLLVAKPSKSTTALFRIHMNYLNGPFLAFLFPDAESRHLPLEQATYWIQHGLMLIIAIYLLRLGGVYNMENIFDFKWNIIGYTTMIIYHFTVLQFLSSISTINLDYMLCASLQDPFQGSNYRIAACIHQALLCPSLCKLITILFSNTKQVQLDVKIITNDNESIYNDYDTQHQQHQHQQHLHHLHHHNPLHHNYQHHSHHDTISATGVQSSSSSSSIPSSQSIIVQSAPVTISRIEDPIMTTKID